jgi:hypothetical protein
MHTVVAVGYAAADPVAPSLAALMSFVATLRSDPSGAVGNPAVRIGVVPDALRGGERNRGSGKEA